MRLATLQDIFRKAEFLLNEPNAIKEAASNDPRMRTVKSRSGGIPLIVLQAVNSTSNLFSCQFSTYSGLGLCSDTVAVAEEQGLLFEYLTDLRTKLLEREVRRIMLRRAPNYFVHLNGCVGIFNRGHYTESEKCQL